MKTTFIIALILIALAAFTFGAFLISLGGWGIAFGLLWILCGVFGIGCTISIAKEN